MNNILDYQGAMMEARFKYSDFQKKFTKLWLQPLVDSQVSMLWSRTPQQAKDSLKQSDPKEYDAMERNYGSKVSR